MQGRSHAPEETNNKTQTTILVKQIFWSKNVPGQKRISGQTKFPGQKNNSGQTNFPVNKMFLVICFLSYATFDIGAYYLSLVFNKFNFSKTWFSLSGSKEFVNSSSINI